MDRLDLKDLIGQHLEDPEGAIQSLLDRIRKYYGVVPLVHEVLTRRPDVALPHLMKSLAVFGEQAILGPRINELIATAVAAALRCDFCMIAHMEKAFAAGATAEEIFQALLVAGSICESSSFAHAFRILNRVEDKRKASEVGG